MTREGSVILFIETFDLIIKIFIRNFILYVISRPYFMQLRKKFKERGGSLEIVNALGNHNM